METKIIRIEDIDTQKSDLLYAADVIKHGGLVVFPTETVYGLGADATNPDAARAVYHAKGRPSDNPLIIHISSPSDVEEYAFSNSTYYSLAENFMPGPLTVVLRSRESIPKETRGGLATVAVRCPESRIARELIKLAGVPIAAPSANLSGSPSPTNALHVIKDMNGRVDVIIDGGDSDFGLESTIVTVDSDNEVTLLRPGKITAEDIEKLGIRVHISDAVMNEVRPDEKVLSPGMKYKHYAPKSPLILVDSDTEAFIEYVISNAIEDTAIIAYSEALNQISEKLPRAEIFDFGSLDNQTEQAHRLFRILRETDNKNYCVIFAPLPSADGIGLALYNRMIRAAAHKIIRL